jgi:ribosomal protein S18 acetylase RimI-like enzyme
MTQFEIKTKEHYEFIKQHFDFKTELEKYLDSSSQVYCCRLNGILIGLSAFKINTLELKININFIAILEEYRNIHQASILLDGLIGHYLTKTIFTCSIKEDNIASRSLFIKKGFKEIGRGKYSDGTVKILMKRRVDG